MFGYDDAELEALRRPPRRLRLWVVAVQVVVGLVLAAPFLLLDLINDTPRLVERLNRAFPAGNFRIELEALEWLPTGSLWDPWSWRFAVTMLDFEPTDPKKPRWSARRATVDLPEPVRVDGGWGLDVGRLVVMGLQIEARQQRPPPPWEPKEGPLRLIRVGEVQLVDTGFFAHEDPPLGEAKLVGARGVLRDLVYRPGARDVSAVGEVHAKSFTTGAITVTDIELPNFELDHSTLRINGRFVIAKAPGTVRGEIRTFHIRSEVALHVEVAGARLGEVITMATGDHANLDGALDLSLDVSAGGDRPRGASLLEGAIRLRDGRFQLGRKTRYVVLDVLRLVPWVELNAYHQVEFRPLQGEVTFSRGRVTLREWTYPIGKRAIRVDGTIDNGALWLFVRLLPRADWTTEAGIDERVGLGMLMWGTTQEQQFKLATRDDLLREQPWVPKIPPPPPEPEPLFPKRAKKKAAAEAAAAEAALRQP